MDELQKTPCQLRPDAMIPCSMWHRFVCFVMYDGHPRDKKKIDITICLQGGTVVELYQRECVSSIKLTDVIKFLEIQIIRNNIGELFYLVAADRDVIILSSTNQLSVHRRFKYVTHYTICDPDCSGEAKLMMETINSPRICVSFGDVKEVSQDNNNTFEDTKSIMPTLGKKLVEAKFHLLRNEEAYNRLKKLTQHASFICHGDDALKLKTSKPIIHFCNKKIVIQLELENPHNESINKVCALIHNNSCNSISYTSKVYAHLYTSPFYEEIEFREIKSKCKATVVAVIPINEFKSSIVSRIELNVIVSYETQNKDYLQSFDNVQISASDVMGKSFDVFNCPNVDERGISIAMLSTTHKTQLCFKQKGLGDMISLSNILSKYLKMDLLGERKTMAVHKHSPIHILHGIMIIFDDDNEYIDSRHNEINYNIDVYARSSAQVMALIHFIYDRVPLVLIVTTPNIQVMSHGDSEENVDSKHLNYNYMECAKSLLNQASLTLQYLDNCLNEMNKSHNIDKMDILIDLYAMGIEEFVKYKNNMLAEAENGFLSLLKSYAQTSDVEEIMDVD